MKPRIAIDAGHGGTDHGCDGHGLIESVLTLPLAKDVVSRLANSAAVEPLLLRIDDSRIELHERAAIANREGCDAVVSLHFDSAAPDRDWTAVYWHRGDTCGQALARKIQVEVEAAGRRCRAYCTDFLVMSPDRGREPGFPRALVLTDCYWRDGLPTCLVEGGFLTSAAGCRWLEEHGLDVLATAIVAGIEAWAGKDRR